MIRSAYSIHVEDLDDRVEWTLDCDEDTVAAGKVSLDDPLLAHASVQLRLNYAFASAYAQAEVERQQRFQRDLEVAAEVAAQEEQAAAGVDEEPVADGAEPDRNAEFEKARRKEVEQR
jgi:hypothetical protein